MATTDRMDINEIVDLVSEEQRKQFVDDLKKMHSYIVQWARPVVGKRRSFNKAILKVYSVDGVEGSYVEKIEMAKSILSNLRIRIRIGHDPNNAPDIYMDAYYSNINDLKLDIQCIEESIYTEPVEVDLPKDNYEIIDNGEEF